MKSKAAHVESMTPLCDGKPAPGIKDRSRNAGARRAFVAIYAEINRLARQLRTVRELPLSPRRAAKERQTLRQIEKALLARDALEDRYRAKGIVADPVFERGIVKDIQFNSPGPKVYEPMASFCFAITPTDAPATDARA